GHFKQDEIPKIMRKHEQDLEDENKHLMYLVPMQPNLHERM
nr:floral homeotic protein PISTILLATA [Tanacetum cinerariifolium]GFB43005.1 floral homeotic protein PISTILLATA [Tanacetum cinerariifolium]